MNRIPCIECNGRGTRLKASCLSAEREDCPFCDGTGRKGGKKRITDVDIRRAIDQLNETRGFKSRAIGYSMYGDIRGDGLNRRSVYTVINQEGGVGYSTLNGTSKRDTLDKINRTILAIRFPEKSNDSPPQTQA